MRKNTPTTLFELIELIDKDTIRTKILPYLTTAKRGYPCKGDLCDPCSIVSTKRFPAGKGGISWHSM